MSDMKSLIDELGAASLECRGLLADVRSATRELRGAVKEANDTIEKLAAAVHDMVQADVDFAVSEQIGKLAEETRKATDDATAAIYKRFDRITNVLLAGNDRQGRTDGGLDLRKLGDQT